MTSVNRRMATGAAWMVLLRLLDRSLGLIGMMILARLLVPADFGLVAMATSFMALIELFGAFGFDSALIRLQEPTERHFNTAWTLNVLLGCFIALVLVAGSHVVAVYYHESRLPGVLWVLAAGAIIGSLENIGIVAFRRDLDFAKEFRFQIAKRLAAFAITIPLAFILRNHWALVAGMASSRLVTTSWSYIVSRYRPKFTLAETGELFGFSKWLLLNNAIGFLKERGFDFVVGRIAGIASLGTFNVAYSIGNMPTSELAAPINRAVFPGYARLAGNMDHLRASFTQVMGVIALFVVPAGIGMAAVAPLATAVLLGPKWTAAIPILEIIAIQGVVSTLQTNMYSVYLAMNKPHVPMWTGAAYVAVLLTLSIWFTQSYGLTGTAMACLVTSLLFVPMNYGIVLYYLRLGPRSVIAESWRPIVAALLVWVAARSTANAFDGNAPALVGLIASIVAGGVAYIIGVGFLWWLSGRPQSAERIVLDRVQAVLRRRVPAT